MTRYEVHELADGEPTLDLGVRHRCDDYVDAAEFVFDFLDTNDPLREGRVSAVEIVKVDGSNRETVLTYRHDRAVEGTKDDLVSIWGFDFTRPWQGPRGPRAGGEVA